MWERRRQNHINYGERNEPTNDDDNVVDDDDGDDQRHEQKRVKLKYLFNFHVCLGLHRFGTLQTFHIHAHVYGLYRCVRRICQKILYFFACPFRMKKNEKRNENVSHFTRLECAVREKKKNVQMEFHAVRDKSQR